MRWPLAFLLLVMMGLGSETLAAHSEDSPQVLTLPQYVQVLDDSLTAVQKLKQESHQAGDFLQSLPSVWHVTADGRSFEISTETIRRDLGAWQKKPDKVVLDRVLQHLETLRYEAAGYQKPSQDSVPQHALLNNILARSEFHNVHGQTWMDRLKQRFNELLIRLLGRAFTSSTVPVIGNVVVYGLIVLAVLALAYWLYRSMREGARLETIKPVNMPVSANGWLIWISEARAAAARGDCRDAIHLAYWAGISFLEMQGTWRPDIARTPREYLRLLPAASGHQPALRALTMRLEAVWYGMHTADADGFQQSLADLERLGCPCN
jgi:hypothetical protein